MTAERGRFHLCQEDTLEKGMVTYLSIFAWRIPMDRGDWKANLWGRKESNMTARLSTTYTFQSSTVCVRVKSLQSWPTLCDLMDRRLPASSVHGILQATILKWVVIHCSRGSSQPRDPTQICCIAGRFFYCLSRQGKGNMVQMLERQITWAVCHRWQLRAWKSWL